MSELYKGQRSISVLVIGKSGRGKSTAMRNLPPDKTHLINVVGKPLPFLAGSAYREGTNMTVTADAATIIMTMTKVSNDPTREYLVLDDTQYIMATEFMSKVMIKGYDKFSIMAKNMWDILLHAGKLRPGLKVFILAHEDDDGNTRKMKTLGRLLDEKLTPEGLSTIVLFADVMMGDEKNTHYFLTQSDGQANAKSPMGMFPMTIPNDLKLIADRIDEYYSGVSLEQSKLDLGGLEIRRRR